MSADYISNLEDEIRAILRALPPTDEEGSLECPWVGEGCGIPGAIMDAIDRWDRSHYTGIRFHTLVSELAFVVSRERDAQIRYLRIHVRHAGIEFEYEMG